MMPICYIHHISFSILQPLTNDVNCREGFPILFGSGYINTLTKSLIIHYDVINVVYNINKKKKVKRTAIAMPISGVHLIQKGLTVKTNSSMMALATMYTTFNILGVQYQNQWPFHHYIYDSGNTVALYRSGSSYAISLFGLCSFVHRGGTIEC